MKKSEEVEKLDSCFNRANWDELIFVTLQRDAAAPAELRAWAARRAQLGKNKADDAQITEALQLANRMANEDPEMFYIRNTGVIGNCVRWWRINGNGYTVDLDEAWRVTKQKAESICSSRPNEDFAIPASKVDLAARRHVDFQDLKELAS